MRSLGVSRDGPGPRLTRGCNGRRRRFAPIAADEPQGRYTDGVDR